MDSLPASQHQQQGADHTNQEVHNRRDGVPAHQFFGVLGRSFSPVTGQIRKEVNGWSSFFHQDFPGH
jgi:hypothetical protein